MIKITLSIVITVFLLATGCVTVTEVPPPRATEAGPTPQKPTHTISVNIDSIPSGADTYAIDTDGQLGAKIGTTPFVNEIHVANQWAVYTDTKERTSIDPLSTLVWRPGSDAVHFESNYNELVLKIALVKGDHSIAVASKVIHYRKRIVENKTISLTVPLKTLAQVNQEMELHLRQQALANARTNNVQSSNQNQNITITQKKDGIDSVNSGLDALIKMSALGAFNR